MLHGISVCGLGAFWLVRVFFYVLGLCLAFSGSLGVSGGSVVVYARAFARARSFKLLSVRIRSVVVRVFSSISPPSSPLYLLSIFYFLSSTELLVQCDRCLVRG